MIIKSHDGVKYKVTKKYITIYYKSGLFNDEKHVDFACVKCLKPLKQAIKEFEKLNRRKK